jgi:uncharacterized protein YecT (DUF1311 family)
MPSLIFVSSLIACGGGSSTSEAPPAEAPAPAPAAPAPVSIESQLDRCLATDAARTPEGSLACAQEASAAWQAQLDTSLRTLLEAVPDAQDALVNASQSAWMAFRPSDAALGASVRQQRSSDSPLDVVFEGLGATRERARLLERYVGASRGEPEMPELSEAPQDQELGNCLRLTEGQAPCVDAAVAAWSKEVDGKLAVLLGLLNDDAAANKAQQDWSAYRDAERALAGALLTDPIRARREEAALLRRRSEILRDLIEQLRTTEP